MLKTCYLLTVRRILFILFLCVYFGNWLFAGAVQCQENTPVHISIPVRFLPDYDISKNPAGDIVKKLKYGNGIIETTADKVALILVDTWEIMTQKEPVKPIGYQLHIKKLLEKCRAYGVTVIHAPNKPVVDRYPQYQALKKRLEDFNNQSPFKKEKTAIEKFNNFLSLQPINQWPPSRFRRQVDEMRQEGIEGLYLGQPPRDRDIVSFLKPYANEYVVESTEELRFVLFTRKINTLFYVGGALNGCILSRPTGAQSLKSNMYVMVLLGDCVYVMPSPGIDEKIVEKVFEDYFMYNVGYVADSKDLQWTP